MLFAPAQVGPHSRCQKVLVMSTCPPVSANHADGCAHGQLIIFSAPVAHVAFTSNWGEAAVHLPCPAAWSPASWAPTPAPPPPCIHALICSPAGDTTSQGCSGGGSLALSGKAALHSAPGCLGSVRAQKPASSRLSASCTHLPHIHSLPRPGPLHAHSGHATTQYQAAVAGTVC